MLVVFQMRKQTEREIEIIEADLMHRTLRGSIDHKTERRALAYFTEINRIK